LFRWEMHHGMLQRKASQGIFPLRLPRTDGLVSGDFPRDFDHLQLVT
jgi:hypothetical protein